MKNSDLIQTVVDYNNLHVELARGIDKHNDAVMNLTVSYFKNNKNRLNETFEYFKKNGCSLEALVDSIYKKLCIRFDRRERIYIDKTNKSFVFGKSFVHFSILTDFDFYLDYLKLIVEKECTEKIKELNDRIKNFVEPEVEG